MRTSRTAPRRSRYWQRALAGASRANAVLGATGKARCCDGSAASAGQRGRPQVFGIAVVGSRWAGGVEVLGVPQGGEFDPLARSAQTPTASLETSSDISSALQRR